MQKNLSKKGSNQTSSASGVQYVPVPENFEIISEKEAQRIKNREREYKAMQRKLTLINKKKDYVGEAKSAMLGKRAPIKDQVELYLASILDPFSVRGVKIPSNIPLPTATFSTYRNEQISVTSYASDPGSIRILAPCHYICEFAATGNDTTGATAAGSYNLPNPVWGHPMRIGGATGQYPAAADPSLCWNITAGSAQAGTLALNTFVPSTKAQDIIDLFSHVRMVSAGLKVTYTGKVLDVEGRVAVALLPPGIMPPQYSGTTAHANIMVPDSFNFTWDEVIELPGAQVYSAGTAFTAVIKPYGDEVEDWQPTKYSPMYVSSWTAELGINAAPPCTRHPATHRAIVDTAAVTVPYLTASNSQYSNDAAIALLRSYETGYGTIVVLYKGADTTAEINVEFTANWEGVPESRALSLASPQRSQAARGPGHAARAVAMHMPTSHVTKHKWYQQVWPVLKKGLNMASNAIGDGTGVKSIMESAATKFGVELPEIFGDVAMAAGALGSFL